MQARIVWQMACVASIAAAATGTTTFAQQIVPTPVVEAAAASGVNGSWEGALSIPGGSLRIVFHLKQGDDGAISGTLDSPDQGVKDIPITGGSATAGKLRIEVRSIVGVYEGSLNEDRQSCDGMWSQGGASLRLVLKRTDKPTTINRPQEPRPPFPYRVENVKFTNPNGGHTLAGTLTTPEAGADKKFAAVVLISGSGPQDRNEEVFGHKPFLILADDLTRRGIAVLRFDDRGVGESTGDYSAATTVDHASDARAALDYLKTRAEIDAKRIGLIGHSEGGYMAPIIAADADDAAFVVLIATPGVDGASLIIRQEQVMRRLGGMDEEHDKIAVDASRRMFDLLSSAETEEDVQAVLPELRRILDELKEAMQNPAVTHQQADAARDAALKIMTSPWFRALLRFDPRPLLARVRCPVLAVTGELDVQVDPKQNLPEIEKALRSGGNMDVTVVEMPGHNHLLQEASTGSMAEYARIEQTMSPAALNLIGEWIVDRTKAPAP